MLPMPAKSSSLKSASWPSRFTLSLRSVLASGLGKSAIALAPCGPLTRARRERSLRNHVTRIHHSIERRFRLIGAIEQERIIRSRHGEIVEPALAVIDAPCRHRLGRGVHGEHLIELTIKHGLIV